jgi:hypothetical protein
MKTTHCCSRRSISKEYLKTQERLGISYIGVLPGVEINYGIVIHRDP